MPQPQTPFGEESVRPEPMQRDPLFDERIGYQRRRLQGRRLRSLEANDLLEGLVHTAPQAPTVWGVPSCDEQQVVEDLARHPGPVVQEHHVVTSEDRAGRHERLPVCDPFRLLRCPGRHDAVQAWLPYSSIMESASVRNRPS